MIDVPFPCPALRLQKSEPSGLKSGPKEPGIWPFFFLSFSEPDQLGAAVKQIIIFEAELLALIVSFLLWKNLVNCAPVVFYVDNNSARDVAISASSRSKLIAGLVEQLLKVEDISSCFCWFARVPSPSNPADAPSRGEVQALIDNCAPLVDVSETLSVIACRHFPAF